MRVANANGVATRPGRGTGTVSGSVFADWNANGQPDPGEEVLAGIPVALGGGAAVTTGRDGQFSFLNVPSGLQQVRLDLNALPVDFDAAAGADVSLELSRGETRRVSFGLLPLGGISGRVFEDANRNGQLDAGEPPVDNAVLVLDGGQRSELARKGQFRFDAVRAGDHIIELLKESLPEGAAIVGASERPAPITREAPQTEFLFLVTIDKRPEVTEGVPAERRRGSARGVRGATRCAAGRVSAATCQHRTARRAGFRSGQPDAGRAVDGADRSRCLHDPGGGADRCRERPHPGR